MKRPSISVKQIDDKTLRDVTGRARADWFKLIDKSKSVGRSAVGKFLQAQKVDAWWIATITVEYEAHAGLVEKDGRPKGYSVCSTKSVSAAAPRAFKAFTTPTDLDAWFGPKASIVAKEGGAIASGDGTRGTLVKVRPDKALVFDWETPEFAQGSKVEVLFQAKGSDKCGLVVNHTRIMTRKESDEVRAMWDEALTKLKAYLES